MVCPANRSQGQVPGMLFPFIWITVLLPLDVYVAIPLLCVDIVHTVPSCEHSLGGNECASTTIVKLPNSIVWRYCCISHLSTIVIIKYGMLIKTFIGFIINTSSFNVALHFLKVLELQPKCPHIRSLLL